MNNIYGTYTVTTEGDCEGKSTRHLGTFTGYVDEIALHLGHNCFYTLYFKEIESLDGEYIPTLTKTNVRVKSLEGNFPNKNTKKLNEIFSEREVTVLECNYYDSFTITSDNDVRAEELKKTALRAKAIAKLTESEREALGIS